MPSQAVYTGRRNSLRRGMAWLLFFAIEDVVLQQRRQRPPRVLSYAAYYARYHTTEERDGWKMANPTGQQVIYVKE